MTRTRRRQVAARQPADLAVGYVLLLLNPFIGLALLLSDPPVWVEALAVVLIVAFVGVGVSLLRRGTGGWWRPSETLGGHRDDAA